MIAFNLDKLVGRDMKNVNEAETNLVMDEVNIYLNMLGALVMNRIGG